MADLLRFTVPGKPEYVGVVRLAVSSAANTAGFDVEDIEDIKIAVSEVCTNVFCKCENTLTYQIVCELGDDGIIISIDDGGMYGEKGGEARRLQRSFRILLYRDAVLSILRQVCSCSELSWTKSIFFRRCRREIC